ncbi:NAD(+) diphosphatase [Methanobacterium oryzae]|uniref:NAD(+) diphosphatase n=1 Tax=Methanobacterium oryzae TaxID=69540 RepID=UPI003D1E4A27
MKRESIYKRYKPAFKSQCASNIPSYWFIFNDSKLLINTNYNLPFTDNLKELSIIPIRTIYLGTLEDHPVYAAEVAEDTKTPESFSFEDLRSLYEFLDEDIYLLAGRAIQIINWDKNHEFCGKCGAFTVTADHEMAKVCPECGHMNFPRISPAVITAIVKNGKLLMAKHSYGGYNRYSLIAGFVEAGETLEEAVMRETEEEVGIKVKNIKYFSSQPWPYPHSLMLGFTAEYDSGEIKVDEKEILDAKWFAPDEIELPPSKMSIASELITWFIEKYSE